MVDLYDKTIQAVFVQVRPGNCSRSTVVARQGLKDSKYVRKRRTRSNAVRAVIGNQDLRTHDLRFCRNEKTEVRAHSFALSFVGPEKESLVLNQRAAERGAKIVVAERTLRCGCPIKVVSRVESAVPQEL